MYEVYFYSQEPNALIRRDVPDFKEARDLAVAILKKSRAVFNATIFDGRGMIVSNFFRNAEGAVVDIGGPWALSRREADRLRIIDGEIVGLPRYVR